MRAHEFITESLRLSDEKRGSKISITILKDGEEIGSNQYNAATGRSIVEVDEQYRNKGYGKILILKMLELCAENSLDFVIDESTTDAYDNTLYSLEDAGYIVIDDQYVYLTEDGLNYLNEFMSNNLVEHRLVFKKNAQVVYP